MVIAGGNLFSDVPLQVLHDADCIINRHFHFFRGRSHSLNKHRVYFADLALEFDSIDDGSHYQTNDHAVRNCEASEELDVFPNEPRKTKRGSVLKEPVFLTDRFRPGFEDEWSQFLLLAVLFLRGRLIQVGLWRWLNPNRCLRGTNWRLRGDRLHCNTGRWLGCALAT